MVESAEPGEQPHVALVLVVDDSERLRVMLEQMLIAFGVRVETAADGMEAVAKYVKYRPDAVLLDISMPELDGLTTLKLIRQIDPKARVSMVTAQGQREKVVEAMKSGATDFVLKPFESSRLLIAVQTLLAA